MPAATAPAPPATQPYGIQPYVDQARERIERHFRVDARDPAQRASAFVVGVFGEWGSGKSTVLSAIGACYDNLPRPLAAEGGRAVRPEVTLRIDFNAWRYEREEYLLIPLMKSIERTLDAYVEELDRLGEKDRGIAGRAKEAPPSTSTWKWLADRAQLVGACTIALTRMVKIKAGLPGFGEVELNPGDALEAAQKQIDRAAEFSSGRKTQRPLESLYYDLYAHLQRLTRGVDAADSARLNFLFLIDDLDRCLPEKAVEMLEAIKLFLDVDGCAFVLALDDEIIERGIAHRYRDYLALPAHGPDGAAARRALAPPITGHEYLEKIVQLPFRLPRWSRREVRDFIGSRFPDELARWSGPPGGPLATTATGPTPDPWLLDLIVDGVPPVPRNLVRAIELLEFTRAVAIERGLGERLQGYPVAQMALLQLFAPACFRFLRRGHAEGWKTFERRLRKQTTEFSGEPKDVTDKVALQPAISSEEFFDWWIDLCQIRTRQPNADPYIARTELPLALMLSESRNNRSGFDPRNLMLLARDNIEVDAKLEPYFSLFADATPASSAAPSPASSAPMARAPVHPQPAPAAAPPSAAAATYVASAASDPAPAAPVGPPDVAPGAGQAILAPAAGAAAAAPASALPAAAPPEPAPGATTSTAVPRDREVFARQLLSRSPDAWRNAVSREEHLVGHTLDERSLDELLALEKTLRQPGDAPREAAWLETIAPLLTPLQMRRLLKETGYLRRLAEQADLLDSSSASAAPEAT